MKVKKLPSEFLQHGWNNSTLAADEQGEPCRPHDPRAASFCLYGAMFAAEAVNANREFMVPLERALKKALGLKWGINTIVQFNDYICKGKDEAVEIMKKAEAAIGLEKE